MSAIASAIASPVVKTVVMRTLSNVFMTFGWSAHRRQLSQKPWIVAALCLVGAVCFALSSHLS